jgi:transcriptional regulator with XRE-family HTH domain
VKRTLYGERDYAFGQLMLTLRTTIGLTQAGLAERLGVSRRAVAEWEAGSSYPKAERLKQLIELGVQLQVFPAGREAEEIRALWKAAHQKVLLDELWLHGLLSNQGPPLSLVHVAPGPGEQAIETLPHPSPILSVAWSPDGRLLATGGPAGQIRLWEIQQTQPATCVAIIVGHTNRVRGLVFAPDGNTLASSSCGMSPADACSRR